LSAARPWTEDEIAEAMARVAERERAAAKARDGPPQTRRKGQPVPEATPARLARAAQVEALLREGWSYKRIEQKLGMSPATISRYRKMLAGERGE